MRKMIIIGLGFFPNDHFIALGARGGVSVRVVPGVFFSIFFFIRVFRKILQKKSYPMGKESKGKLRNGWEEILGRSNYLPFMIPFLQHIKNSIEMKEAIEGKYLFFWGSKNFFSNNLVSIIQNS